MSTYNKTVWQDGDIITADKMNNIENGIYSYNEDLSESVGNLKSAFSFCAKERSSNINDYFYANNKYINTALVEASSGSTVTTLCKIPKQGSSIIAIRSSISDFYSPMTLANSLHFYDSTGAKSIATTFYKYYNNVLIALIPSAYDGIFLNVTTENLSNVSVEFSAIRTVISNYVGKTMTSIIDADSGIKTNSYKRNSAWSNIDDPFYTYWYEAKAGDRITFSNGDALVYNASFIASDGIGQAIPKNSIFTVPSDGWLGIIFNPTTGLPNFVYTPVDAISIDASNVVGAKYRTEYSSKVWTSFGDSITYYNRWQPYIIAQTEMHHNNCGIGGTCLAGSDENAFHQDVRINAVKATNPDIITILGGANDCFANIPIGTESNLLDMDTNTFIGAYSYILNNLLTWKPSLKIVILSTTYAHNNGEGYNNTYDKYANACKKVAEYYHLPFVDLYNQSGFNRYTMGDDNYAIYSDDNIHPNDAGARIIASMVWQKFKETMLFT